MKKLGERNATLLLRGAENQGNFVDGLMEVGEELYFDEYDTLESFCKYLDNNIGGAGRYNIEQLFKSFINPDDKGAAAFAETVRIRISEIRSL